jgi:isoleucyl-tRNA synthetase
VALDLTVTPALRRAGLAREVVRLVQDARKVSGFDVSDRVSLWWLADGDIAAALREHGAMVAEEVLASHWAQKAPEDPAAREFGDEELGLRFWLVRA